MTSDRISSRKPSFSMGVTLRPHPIQSTAFYSAPTSDLHRVLRTTFPSESSQLAVGSRGPLDTVVVSSLLGVALCCSKPWLAVRLFSKSILHAWGHLPRTCSFSGSGVFFVSGHHQKKKSTYLIQSGIMQWELGNCDCHQLEKFLLGFLQKFFPSFHPDYPGSFCRGFFLTIARVTTKTWFRNSPGNSSNGFSFLLEFHLVCFLKLFPVSARSLIVKSWSVIYFGILTIFLCMSFWFLLRLPLINWKGTSSTQSQILGRT